MTPSTTATTAVGVRRVALRLPAVPWDAVTAWALAFALVLYLALRGGGFDAVVRDQVGILVWWAVLLVAVAGLLPRLTRAGWIVLGLLAAWAAWTALGIGSSESAERTLAEVGRLCAYTGVLALALTLQARAGSRHVLNAVATAIGVVTVLAVLSRLHPQWFPGNDHMRFLPDEARRLSYPLNYWNALAGFLAMGAVLLLAVAATARTRLGQFLAAATVPLAGLGCYLAISRGGAIVFVVGLINYMLLTVDRLARLGTLAVTGGAAALLIVAADQRPAIQTGLDTAAAREQGAELLWLCVIVCIGAGLVHVAIELLARHADRPPWMRVDRRRATASFLAGLGSVVVVFFASGLNHELADRWAEFKQPPEVTGRLSTDSVFARFDSGAGQGRWQYWQVALDAFQENPARGIGGGAFELYWARNATVEGSITDAHSLYAQTLAEVGWVGFALLLGLVVLTVAGGAVRALRRSGTERVLLAGATAAAVVFWLQAAIEWTWQIAVMPVALLLLAAVIVGHRDPETRPAGMPVRVLAVAAAIAAFIPIALALSTLVEVRASQQAVRDGRLEEALAAARRADALAGTSASAMLQQALVLEQMGEVDAARAQARRAADAEPTNWRHRLTLARLELRAGDEQAALAHFRAAKRLNPKSPLFAP